MIYHFSGHSLKLISLLRKHVVPTSVLKDAESERISGESL
jgi:hypothetical protein